LGVFFSGEVERMKHVGRAACLLILLALTASPAYSCSCADIPQRKVFRASRAVLLGEFVESFPSNDKDFLLAVKFKVIKQWKGEKKPDHVLLWGYDIPEMCGDLKLEKGERYLIYADREKNNLIVHTDCGRSSHIKYAEGDVRKLNNFFYRLAYRIYPF
jgi:hypothetical protein